MNNTLLNNNLNRCLICLPVMTSLFLYMKQDQHAPGQGACWEMFQGVCNVSPRCVCVKWSGGRADCFLCRPPKKPNRDGWRRLSLLQENTRDQTKTSKTHRKSSMKPHLYISTELMKHFDKHKDGRPVGFIRVTSEGGGRWEKRWNDEKTETSLQTVSQCLFNPLRRLKGTFHFNRNNLLVRVAVTLHLLPVAFCQLVPLWYVCVWGGVTCPLVRCVC